ncbi:MAG: hypothetical protein QOH88_1639 [Verrucomicrobiota bacterium]|jgi:hypothetical protein
MLNPNDSISDESEKDNSSSQKEAVRERVRTLVEQTRELSAKMDKVNESLKVASGESED